MNDGDPYTAIQRLRTFCVVSSLTLTSGVLRYFNNRWPTPSSDKEVIEYLIIFAHLAVPFVIWATAVYLVFPVLLGRSWFRRWVLGNHYIEGYWFEWNVEHGIEKRRHSLGRLSVIIIQPNKDKEYLVISGQHFDEKGLPDKTFRCFPYMFDWPDIRYVYAARQTSPFASEDVEGSGEFRFHGSEGPPQEFDGSYAYGGVEGAVIVMGRRLTEREVQEYRRADTRGNLIERVVAEYGGVHLKLSGKS
jgi:hypothetical protein